MNKNMLLLSAMLLTTSLAVVDKCAASSPAAAASSGTEARKLKEFNDLSAFLHVTEAELPEILAELTQRALENASKPEIVKQCDEEMREQQDRVDIIRREVQRLEAELVAASTDLGSGAAAGTGTGTGFGLPRSRASSAGSLAAYLAADESYSNDNTWALADYNNNYDYETSNDEAELAPSYEASDVLPECHPSQYPTTPSHQNTAWGRLREQLNEPLAMYADDINAMSLEILAIMLSARSTDMLEKYYHTAQEMIVTIVDDARCEILKPIFNNIFFYMTHIVLNLNKFTDASGLNIAKYSNLIAIESSPLFAATGRSGAELEYLIKLVLSRAVYQGAQHAARNGDDLEIVMQEYETIIGSFCKNIDSVYFGIKDHMHSNISNSHNISSFADKCLRGIAYELEMARPARAHSPWANSPSPDASAFMGTGTGTGAGTGIDFADSGAAAATFPSAEDVLINFNNFTTELDIFDHEQLVRGIIETKFRFEVTDHTPFELKSDLTAEKNSRLKRLANAANARLAEIKQDSTKVALSGK